MNATMILWHQNSKKTHSAAPPALYGRLRTELYFIANNTDYLFMRDLAITTKLHYCST